MTVLEVDSLYYKQDKFILKDINLKLEKGQIMAVYGRSGSGKSTLVRLLGNAVSADYGVIKYFGKELYEDEENIRKSLAVIYNHPDFGIESKMDIFCRSLSQLDGNFDREKFHDYLEALDISHEAKLRFLSDSDRRKCMFALALARKAGLIIVDDLDNEPDADSYRQAYGLLQDYRQENECSIIFTTNKSEIARKYADFFICIKGGCMYD